MWRSGGERIGRDAVIERPDGDGGDAERMTAETACVFALEHEGREDAAARLRTAMGCLEFVEPMYVAMRARHEDLHSQHWDLSKRHGKLGDKNTALDESLTWSGCHVARRGA